MDSTSTTPSKPENKTMDMTTEAMQGYEAGMAVKAGGADMTMPYYDSSASAIAWLAGQWLALTNRSAPRNVRMSRGYTIRANDMLLRWHGGPNFERIN
jgi:hypothetical protein